MVQLGPKIPVAVHPTTYAWASQIQIYPRVLHVLKKSQNSLRTADLVCFVHANCATKVFVYSKNKKKPITKNLRKMLMKKNIRS